MHTLVYNPDLITETNRRVFEALRDLGRELMKPFQLGFAPDESESLRLDVILKKLNVATFSTNTDMAADLELLLFTNVAPGETITEAALTEPTGTGYARITLVDGSWTGSGDTRSFALQTFTAGAGGWSGNVQGYAIVTKAAGTGVQRILIIEEDPNGPYTFAENASYDITPNISAS